jgi:phage gp36-like protein
MTYATQQDLTDRFGAVEIAQLSDRTNGAVVDAVVVGRALSDADAEIDAYLATRYQLPLASVPPVLARMAADVARYRLYDDKAVESVRVRYQDAVSLLKRMARGEVQLPAALPLAATTSGAGNAVAARTDTKHFSASPLAAY